MLRSKEALFSHDFNSLEARSDLELEALGLIGLLLLQDSSQADL
jgi:hypothetical protein